MHLQPSFLVFEAASSRPAGAAAAGAVFGMRELRGTVSRFRGAPHAPPDH